MNNNNCCIIIPIYKNDLELENTEIKSIHNTLSLMYKYDIYFVAPYKINKEFYINEFINKYDRSNIYIKYFDDYYFENRFNYSLLCLSTTFYRIFLDYKYMLICQPDAWIFYDNLEYFCNKGYDYLGAFATFSDKKIVDTDFKNTWHVLNGGFSLRNIKKLFDAVQKYDKDISKIYLTEDLIEDAYICDNLKNDLNIPIYDKIDFDTIFTFAGEIRCDEIYPYLCNRLPFGCHNFESKEYLINTFLKDGR